MRYLPSPHYLSELAQQLDEQVDAQTQAEWSAFLGHAQDMLATGQLGGLWVELMAWHDKLKPSGEVGAPWHEHDSGYLLEYMIELDAEVRRLDDDVHRVVSDPATDHAAFVSFHIDWMFFAYGKEGQDPEPGRFGWYPWFDKYKGWHYRWFSTDDVWRGTEQYEKRFIELHTQFKELGYEPTQKEIKPGPDKPPPEPLGMSDVRTWFNVGAVIAILAIGVYALKVVKG